MVAFSLSFVAAALLFLTFGEYTRRVRVSGVMLPVQGLTRLVASQPGRVENLFVHDGQTVRAGDLLYVLGLDSTTSLGDTNGGIVAALRDRRRELVETLQRQGDLAEANKRRLIEQVGSVASELDQVGAQVSLLEQITEEMKGFAKRQQDLMAKGITTMTQYEDRLQAYNASRMQLEALRRETIQLKARHEDLNGELSAFDLETAEKTSAIRQQILEVDQEIGKAESQREVRITAPRDGTITGIISLVGQTVNAGTPLLTIVPSDQPLVAQLLAPTNAIGFVRKGSDVLLRYAAFPYQKFGQYAGSVELISRATLRPEEVALLNAGGGFDAASSPSLYRITVTPKESFVNAYGRQEPLQAGMQVEAHILAETRPLYQWLLEPIYGLRGSVSAGGNGA
ncbi:HlyD family secretion protein [Rhizobium sp. HT1-10]|uniref:HlyD family secretion protein n=1 Tax=Rhizobium sp. HT1-10 TaxID=3111638 RepID=UPI003C15445E